MKTKGRLWFKGIKESMKKKINRWSYNCETFCNVKKKHKHKFKTISKPNLHILVAGRQVIL